MSITHEDVKKYYNQTYYNKDAGRPEWHYKTYLEKLGVQSGKKILDIACGKGEVLKAAHEAGLDAYGVDISDAAIALAKAKYPFLNLTVGIAEALPFEDNTFDYINCLGSFEHFLDQPKALQEMIRVGKPGVKILIMVPNVNFEFIDGWEGTDQQAIKETLLTDAEWSKLIEDNGLKIQKRHRDKWPVRWIGLPKRKPLVFLKNLYLRYKIWSLPVDKCYQIIYICTVK
jgi:SAM-dependent methyltransferase